MAGNRNMAAGIAWGSAAALLTAGWWVMTRYGVTSTASPYELTAIRFTISGLLLAPALWRHRACIAAVPVPLLFIMVLCAGAPYSLLTGIGLRAAPAGNGGALVAGSLPFFTTLLSVAVLKESVGTNRWIGIAVILLGISGLCGSAADPASLPLFITAGLMWAAFTVALRRSGLPVIAAVALVSCVSAMLYLPAYLLLGPDLPHRTGWLADVLPHALYQGIVSAIIAVYCFGRAVHLLGASRASLFAAFVPVLASIFGAALLSEVPSGGEAVLIATVAIGAALASGALQLPRLIFDSTILMRRASRLPHEGTSPTTA